MVFVSLIVFLCHMLFLKKSLHCFRWKKARVKTHKPCTLSKNLVFLPMPIVNLSNPNSLEDGRQSENAMLVRRGVQRLMLQHGHAVIPELSLANGRRADLVVLTKKNVIWVIEIKSSIEDLRVDKKWPEYRAFCDRLYFATHPDVPQDIFPTDAGFILSDGYGAEILEEAPEHKLSAATRKALTLRFARNAASRLTRLELNGTHHPTDQDFSE